MTTYSIEIIGWIAGISFAVCSLPQAIECYKQKHAHGISLLFILLWLIGEVLMQVYVILKHGLDLPLLVNCEEQQNKQGFTLAVLPLSATIYRDNEHTDI